MKRVKVRWILFPSFLFTVFFALGVMTLASGMLLEREATRDIEKRLRSATELVVSSLNTCIPTMGRDACTQMICTLMSKGETSLRFTGVDTDGSVICDSQFRVTEKLDSRKEVMDAISRGEGISIRYSRDGHARYIYYARYLKSGSAAMVVRMARPFSKIEEIMNHRYVLMYYGGIVALLLAGLLSFLVTRTMVRPLEELREGAERLASGDLEWRVEAGRVEEHARVAEALNRMAQELSERIREVARRREELEAVFEAMTDGVLIFDDSGRVMMANHAALRLLECEGIEECPDRVPAISMVYKKMKLSGERVQRELELGEKYFLMHGKPFKLPNEDGFNAVLIVTDITYMRKLEEVRKRFVSNVSHELKTPLTAIKGYVETLLVNMPENHPAKIREFMKRIESQVDRMASIIEDLLILTRIEQEEKEGRIETLSWDICETVQMAIGDVEVFAREKDIEVEFDCSKPRIVNGNHSLLRVAIYNLLDNAVKYTPRGSGVRVSFEEEGKMLHIRVSDNGPGIPREHLPHLFERFYRVDKSRSRKLGGTGLGLSIVKHIAGLHNGTVSVESEEGKGTTFILSLPATFVTDPGISQKNG